MKTAIKVINNDYLNFDDVGVIINISLETDEIKVLFYQYNAKEHKYYIFLRMMELLKFGMTNEGATTVYVADKLQIQMLEEKPFEGWLLDKIEYV